MMLLLLLLPLVVVVVAAAVDSDGGNTDANLLCLQTKRDDQHQRQFWTNESWSGP